MTGILKRIYRSIFIMLLILGGISILVSDFAFPKAITNIFPLPHWVYGISAGILVLGLCFCTIKFRLRLEISRRTVLISSILLGILQFWINYNRYFYLGWDSGILFDTLVKEISQNYGDINHFYFSVYNNNLMILYIYKMIGGLANLCGIDIETGILILNQIVNTATGILVYLLTDELYKSKNRAGIAFIIYHLFLGFSPWIMVPYTDSIAILFPVLIVYLYLRIKKENKNNWLKAGLLCALAVIGYYIKPQIIIAFIATVMVTVLHLIEKYKEISCKGIIQIVMGGIVGAMVPILIYYTVVVPDLHLVIYEDYSLGPYHYIMMGLNTESNGSYNGDDVLFSISYPNQKTRIEAEKKEIQHRISELGPSGLIKLYAKKMSMNYGDGTFAWFCEGDFFIGVPLRNSEAVNVYLYDWILLGERYYDFFLSEKQIQWMMILIMMLVGGILDKNQRIAKEDVLYISIIGITLFELIFEARARYLFAFAPIYVILASIGFSRCVRALENNKKRT